MTIDAALIKEQGVTFAVVVVKPHVLNSPDRTRLAQRFSRYWDGVPVVFMAQNGRGIPTYLGRPDLVDFLASIPLDVLPWRRWSVH